MGSPSAQATGRKAGAVPVMTVDLAALFAELAESQTQEVEGYTTEEIAERIGKSQAVVRKLIRSAIENGSCEAVRRPMKDITGVVCARPAYRFKGVQE